MSNEKETEYMLEIPIQETICRRICIRLDEKDLEKLNRDPDVKISHVDKEGNYAAPFKILDSYYLKETLPQNPLLQQLVDANKKGIYKIHQLSEDQDFILSKTSLHANLPVYITLTDKAPTKEYTFSHFPYKYSDDHIYVHCPVHVENTIKSLEGNGDVVTTERFFEKTIVVPVSLQDTRDNGKFLLQVKKKIVGFFETLSYRDCKRMHNDPSMQNIRKQDSIQATSNLYDWWFSVNPLSLSPESIYLDDTICDVLEWDTVEPDNHPIVTFHTNPY